MADDHRVERGDRRSYESVWKNVALFLGGICLSGSVAWATYVRTAVTTMDVQGMINENEKVLQVEIDQLGKQYDTVNAKLDYIIENPDRPKKR